ncbi:MAG: CPBP family intramembrane metalloprotease [Candidatus Lokiarchaeota archaeon]|nr:CPBP family intramembrane metalloprotease [Candidatus Lokiarchaeota archaeon]
MGFSLRFWIFLLLCLLEFLLLFGPAIYFKLVRKEKMYSSIILRSFPQKRSIPSRVGDVVMGMSAGVFLSFFAQGFLYASILAIIRIFGENFYNTASSGSIDVVPVTLSVSESIVTILINFVIIGVCEEYFFRGVLFLELKKVLGKWSYPINGLIFALYHVFPGIVPIQTTITYFFYYYILGILLCLLVKSQNNDLLSNMIAHGMFNSIPILLSFF